MPGKRKANDEPINAKSHNEVKEIEHQTRSTKKTKFHEANTEIEEEKSQPVLRRSERIKAKETLQSDGSKGQKSKSLQKGTASKEKNEEDEGESQPKKKLVLTKQKDKTKTKDKKEKIDMKSPSQAIKERKKEEHNGNKEEKEEDEKGVKEKKIVNQDKRGLSKDNENSKSPTKKTTKSNEKKEEEKKKNEEEGSGDAEISIYCNKPPFSKKVNTGAADFSVFGQNKDKVAFVDKTLLIKEVSEKLAGGQSLLVTRPRRSGKSLNLSMLYWYYSIHEKNKHDSIFEGTKINEYKEFKEKNANKYPVVFLDFKEFESRASAPDGWPYNQFFIQLNKSMKDYQDEISSSTKLDERLKDEFIQLADERYQKSLATPYSDVKDGSMKLLQILEKHYGKKCVVLIDEYDAPYNIILSQKTNVEEDMPIFKCAYNNFLSSALKASECSLHFCVMAGVLNIKYGQLLSGLNNLQYDQLFSSTLKSNYFGFTETEAKYFMEDVTGESVSTIKMEEMRMFYDGYRILHSKESYYNPLSIAGYVETQKLYAYWEHTSTDRLLRNCYEMLPNLEKAELAFLFENDLPIQKPVCKAIFMDDIMKNSDLTWTILFHAGYLTFCEGPQPIGDTKLYSLKIPNRDVKQAFKVAIKIFRFLLPSELIQNTYDCFKADDVPKFFFQLNDWIKDDTGNNTSYSCASGAAYHMLLYQTLRIALESQYTSWKVYSERMQTGCGDRFDIVVVCSQRVYLIGVKFLDSTNPHLDIQHALQEAVNQIDEKDSQKFIQGINLPITKIGVVGQNRTLYHHISNK